MRQTLKFLCAVMLFAGSLRAVENVKEITTTDGITYELVRWGPVNGGKVVIFHNRGVNTVPLENLPEEWARKFGYRPPAREPEPRVDETDKPPANEWPAPPVEQITTFAPVPSPEPVPPKPVVTNPGFDLARNQKMVLDGALVNRDQLTVLVGFVRQKARIKEDDVETAGVILELANRKNGGANAPTIMEMRPGLWEGTGAQVFLRGYPQDTERDSLIRVYARAGEDWSGYRTYHVAQELTLNQWKKLR